MIKEAIDKILSLGTPNEILFNGLTFTDKPLTRLTPPEADEVKVSTLQGLVDLYKSDLDAINTNAKVLVHVTSPFSVELISKDADFYGRRHLWVKAQYPTDIQRFPFGQFLNPENFVIAVQSGFQRVLVQNDNGSMALDLDYVLRTASGISAGTTQTSEDDGISQTVNMKRGVVLKGTDMLKSRVNLAPFRTFPEIDQVLSQFIFRAQGDEQNIKLALFEGDGGRWRLNAVAAISAWLSGKFGETPIIS
jgi:hypothetical protein